MRNDVMVGVASAPVLEQREAQDTKAHSMWLLTLRRLQRSKTALAGLVIVAILLLAAVGASVIAPYSPTQTTSESLALPTWKHPMGTDLLGRDVLSRIIHGSRISVHVGVVSILLAIFIGIPLGTVAGFYGGRIDNLIMRLMDVMLAFPHTCARWKIAADPRPRK